LDGNSTSSRAGNFPLKTLTGEEVAKEYILAVKGIIKADADLRAMLETDLLEDIARNTAHHSHRDLMSSPTAASLQTSYGYLKLYTLDSTDRTDAIRFGACSLSNRCEKRLPPTRYDLPLDLKRQLQEQGQLDANLSPEALSHYRREYFQQPVRKGLRNRSRCQPRGHFGRSGLRQVHPAAISGVGVGGGQNRGIAPAD
jgi:hypothetical protein